MAIQLASKGISVREQVTPNEWSARVELAAGHRVLAHYGINDLTYNHFGLRVPGEPDNMLIKRTDWMFEEVTASSLLKVDFDGNVLTDTDVKTIKGGALIIHAGLLKGRPDLNATLHTHTVSGMGVAAHKFGLLPIMVFGVLRMTVEKHFILILSKQISFILNFAPLLRSMILRFYY